MLRFYKTFVELCGARINPHSMEAIRIKHTEEDAPFKGADLGMESLHRVTS